MGSEVYHRGTVKTKSAMTECNFINNFRRLVGLWESWLSEEFSPSSLCSSLEEAYRYSLFSPGKRLRPVLALASAEMLNVPFSRIKPFALAIEYIHTFSLIHDDLPAMDNDSLRRGKPTCHVKFGEATALLAGDALVGKAFSLLASRAEEEPEICASLTGLLARTLVELCEGQMMDLEASGRGSPSEQCLLDDSREQELLEERHMKKTGALIRASLIGPTRFLQGTVQRETEKRLSEYGSCLGLLFQITDDILDATSTTEVLGKDAASDARQGTPTYVSVFGLEQAGDLAAEVAIKAKCALSPFGEKAAFLVWLCDYVLERER